MSYFASCRLGHLDLSSLAAVVPVAVVADASDSFDASHWISHLGNAANSLVLAVRIHFD